jgi:hypothetical protein
VVKRREARTVLSGTFGGSLFSISPLSSGFLFLSRINSQVRGKNEMDLIFSGCNIFHTLNIVYNPLLKRDSPYRLVNSETRRGERDSEASDSGYPIRTCIRQRLSNQNLYVRPSNQILSMHEFKISREKIISFLQPTKARRKSVKLAASTGVISLSQSFIFLWLTDSSSAQQVEVIIVQSSPNNDCHYYITNPL